MRQQKLITDNPNIFSFLCECTGPGIVILVHEIPNKESGEPPDEDYASWYFCTFLNLSAYVMEVFKGVFKMESNFLSVPLSTPEQRETYRKVQAEMLRKEGFTEDQIAVAIGVMCDYSDAAFQDGHASGFQTAVATKPIK